jgi:hypothetical protein
MDEVEQLLRDGLRERAGRVDTTAPVVAAARRTVRRRRGLRAGLASAVAVAAVVVGAVVLVGTEPGVGPAPDVPATEGVDPAVPAGEAWRTEYWHDLAVDVPADWTWGPAPLRTGGAPHICGDKPRTAYVGRPIHMSDLCIGGDDYVRDTSAPYVWLGADVEPGTVDLGDGFTQETREVAGTVVTVATRDAALRARILATATRSRTACDPALGDAAPDLTVVGEAVCVYRPRGRSGRDDLVYAGPLAADRAARFEQAYAAAAPFLSMCDLAPTEHVVLALGGRRYDIEISVVGCSVVVGPDGARRLTPELADPWVADGVPYVVAGPRGGKGAMINSFIRLPG